MSFESYLRNVGMTTVTQPNLCEHPLVSISQSDSKALASQNRLPVGVIDYNTNKPLRGKKPFIGITMTDHEGMWFVRKSYLDLVSEQGGTPLLLPTIPSLASRYEQYLDGLILTGGGDISPRLWKQEDDVAGTNGQTLDPDRDSFELELLNRSVWRIPVLGVCRGMQMINVGYGGSLRHVEGHAPRNHDYLGMINNVHPIQFENGGFGSYRDSVQWVNSGHHYGIDRLASGFSPLARSKDDNVIEMIEGFRTFGVQFHPEAMDTQLARGVFEWLFAEAKKG